jgi:aminopeptidase YwaD
MPKNFHFYNPEEHQHIIRLLETKRPEAIIAATSRSPEMAGAVYPFPLIEDGDFDIPSVYATEEEGARLARRAGELASLDVRALRSAARGYNVIARQGARPDRRVVLFAHIDTKPGTPGALDNAGGVVVLLLLAELLTDPAGDLTVELVAMNGEDYYSNPGELQYLNRNRGRFAEMVLGVNLDGVGFHEGETAYSLYGCPDDLAALLRETLSGRPGMIEGEPWYQGDHAIFLVNEVPTLAFTSDRSEDMLANVVHTPKDRPELVAADKLVDTAVALRDIVLELNHPPE